MPFTKATKQEQSARDAYHALTRILVQQIANCLSGHSVKVGAEEYKLEILQVKPESVVGRITGPLAGSQYFYNFDIRPESYGLSGEIGGELPIHRSLVEPKGYKHRSQADDEDE